jgi:hypothetical protein
MKTTKLRLLTCAFLLNCQVFFAQSNISIGVIGGPMAVNFRNDNNAFIKKEWMLSFSIGTAFRFGLDKHFFIQTELSYERKGFSYSDIQWTDFNGILSDKFTVNELFNYALLTPTIGFSFGQKLHFEGAFGIFGGYLTSAETIFGINPVDLPASAFQPNIDNLNRFDYGITARIGAGFELAKKLSLNVNAVGNLGLDKPYKPLPSNAGNLENKTFSTGLQMGLFYKL